MLWNAGILPDRVGGQICLAAALTVRAAMPAVHSCQFGNIKYILAVSLEVSYY